MKKKWTILSTLICLSGITPISSAAATPKRTLFQTEIDIPGEAVSRPEGFVDSGTVYMPVWYVMQALKKLAFHTDWNGHDWKIDAPKGLKVDVSHVGKGTGIIHIYLNGVLVQKVNGIVATEQGSNTMTMYIPVWYLMNTLGGAQVVSNWNGKKWTITLPKKPKSAGVGNNGTNSNVSGSGASGGNSSSAGGTTSGNSGSTSGSSGSTSGSSGSTSGSSGSTSGSSESTSDNSGSTSGSSGSASGSSGSASDSSGSASDSSGSASDSSGSANGANNGTSGNQPIVVVPQPPLPSNEVAKYDFLSKLLPLEGIAPDPSGQNSYDDIATTDANWGFVNAALERHLLTPDSSTHSGAYEALTLAEADEIYWNAIGITNPSYQPGGDPFDWGNAIQLNPPNETALTDISPADEQAMLNRISAFSRGYVQTGTNYQVVYPPTDEYSATFAGAVNLSTGQSYFSNQNDIQQAITQTYQFFNHVTIQTQDSNLIIAIPSTVNTNWFAYAATMGQIQYSIDGGHTYIAVDAFDSRELTGKPLDPSEPILLKANMMNGLSLSLNQLLPSFGGTISLGQVTISDNGGTVSIMRTNLNS